MTIATVHAATCVSSSELHAHERRLQHALRTLNSPGSEQPLQPLAVHMADRRLVRARSDAGVALRRLDPGLLREALSRLLRNDWDRGY